MATSRSSDVTHGSSTALLEQIDIGGVADSQPNNNASSPTPQSPSTPNAAIHNPYQDPVHPPRDESKPHYTYRNHFLTPGRMNNASAAVDPTPAAAAVRFGDVDPSVQRAPSGRPQPFQRPSTTVLEDSPGTSANNPTPRQGIDPEECTINYDFSNCDDSEFENIREADIQRSIHAARGGQRAHSRTRDVDNNITGSRLFPNARVPVNVNPRGAPPRANSNDRPPPQSQESSRDQGRPNVRDYFPEQRHSLGNNDGRGPYRDPSNSERDDAYRGGYGRSRSPTHREYSSSRRQDYGPPTPTDHQLKQASRGKTRKALDCHSAFTGNILDGEAVLSFTSLAKLGIPGDR